MSARPAARLGDLTLGSCSVHGDNIGGVIIGGNFSLLVNGRPIAQIGDSVLAHCGHTSRILTGDITTQPSKIKIATARLGDVVGLSPYVGVIVTASTDTFVKG